MGRFIVFVLCVVGYTTTGQRRLVVILSAVGLLLNSYLQRISPKYLFWYYVLIVGAIFGSTYRYGLRMDLGHNGLSGDYYIGTGIITNHMKQGQYEYKDASKQHWIISTSKDLSIGSTVSVSATISQTSGVAPVGWSGIFGIGRFDYGQWLWMRGYQGVLKPLRISLLDQNSTELTIRPLLSLRRFVNDRVRESFGSSREGGLLLGMLIGSKSGLSKNEYDGFVASGLVHLIAVSGSNVMMISILLGLILFWLPYYIRLGTVAVGIVCYASLCGWDSSVVRAVIMGLLGICALYGGRVVDVMRIIPVTVVMMLLRNPYYLVYDLGFQLSFGAVVGLVITTQRRALYREHREESHRRLSFFASGVSRFVSDYIIPCVGATIGVLPVLILFGGNYNLMSLPGNLVIQPLVPLMIVLGMVTLLLGSGGVGVFLSMVSKQSLAIVFFVSDQINNHGYWLVVSGFGRFVICTICVGALLYMGYYTRTNSLYTRTLPPDH